MRSEDGRMTSIRPVQKLLTISEVADILGLRYPRAADIIRRSVIPAVRIGRQVRIAPDALHALIRRRIQTRWRRAARRIVSPIDVHSIDQIWRALGGGKLRGRRGRAFWRNGSGYNVALCAREGTWHDFATNEGGGKLKLVQTACGCSKHEAFKWLADMAGISLSPPQTLTPEQKRSYVKERRIGAEVASLAGAWLESRCEELERLKVRCNGDSGQFDERALEAVASELWRLRQLSPRGVIADWETARQTSPGETRRLEAEGRVWEQRYQAVVQRIVGAPWGVEGAKNAS